MADCLAPYEPVDVLKPVAENVWIVDGSVVRMTYPWIGVFSLPFSTRMTVIRLPDGRLWLHSPTAAEDALVEAVSALGEVAFLVAPNRLHHIFVDDWARRFPAARVYAAPGVAEAAERFPEDYALLGDEAPAEWGGAIEQVALRGRFMTEIVFRHLPSATVIVTDLIENFEKEKVRCTGLWWLLKLGGVAAPGSTPRDLKMTFPRKDPALRRAGQEIAGWAPDRIILSHGALIETDAAARLRRIMAWLA